MFKGAARFKRSGRFVLIALAFLVVLLLSIVYFFSYMFCAFCYFNVLIFVVNHFTNHVYLLFIILCQFSVVNFHCFNCLVFRYTLCYLFFFLFIWFGYFLYHYFLLFLLHIFSQFFIFHFLFLFSIIYLFSFFIIIKLSFSADSYHGIKFVFGYVWVYGGSN